MELILTRHKFNGNNTIGRLTVDGKFFAHTLEDLDRNIKKESQKVQNQTAIGYGKYQVTVTKSARFKKELPLLLDVPFFSGIRIHGGNTDEDTEGCILVGASTNEKTIWNCPAKVAQLTNLIKAAILKGEKVYITICKEFDKATNTP
jgi:hypothetical protein